MYNKCEFKHFNKIFQATLSYFFKEKQLKRAEVVWRNAAKNIEDVTFLFKIYDLSMKYDVDSITYEIKKEIWSKRDKKEVWVYVAFKELQVCV